MPAYARRQIVDEITVGVYHCVNRCVRRAFLCGQDALTGRSFEHRRQWIRDRLEQLAGLFAIDILGFAVMQNHLHAILRIRPDLAAAWTDEEVARRWWELFPARRDHHGKAEPPEQHELRALMADPSRLAELRRRLASLSWLMRSLSEPIARRANREDGCTGRFWEGRFKCQALLDETAILACSAYVDLNPIRAGLADMPDESQFTAVDERIAAFQADSVAAIDGGSPAASLAPASDSAADDWLAPIALEPVVAEALAAEPIGAEASVPQSTPSSLASATRQRRASNLGFLPMGLTENLQSLDWTGREMRQGKSGTIPASLAPMLERLGVNALNWSDTVQTFGRRFRRDRPRRQSGSIRQSPRQALVARHLPLPPGVRLNSVRVNHL